MQRTGNLSGWARAVCALLCLGAAASADVLVMKDGRVFENVQLERGEEQVLVRLEAGEIRVPTERVQECLIEGVSTWEPSTPEEQEKFDKGLVPYEGRWISAKKRENLLSKRISERREAIEEMRTHSEWTNRYQKSTKRFHYHYTIPQHVFAELEQQLEAYFDVFAKDWRVKIKKHGSNDGRLAINIYGNRKEYNRTSGAGSYTLGYFKFVGAYDLNIFYDRTDPDGTRDVMFHEVGHYLHKLIDQGFRYPHWPGESLCEYYGAGYWDEEEGELVIGLMQEGRLAEIKADIAKGEWIGLEELITKDRYEDYTWGWSLVHFLMNDDRYASKFKKFFLGLAKDRKVKRSASGFGKVVLKTVSPQDVLAFFKKSLGLKNDEAFRELEREWHQYVDEELQLESASGLEKAAVKAMREGRTIRAKRLFQEAIEAGTERAQTYYNYGTFLYREGDKSEAAEMLEKAVEYAPLQAEYYWSLAYAIRKKDKERSKQLARMAKELDPDVKTKSALGS